MPTTPPQGTVTLKYDREKITYTQKEPQKRSPKFEIIKILGQINRMYILCEDSNGLVIFDQHVVEERVNYEKFMRFFKDKKVPMQTLLQPKIMDLTSQEHRALLDNKTQLKELGYTIEDYGKTSIIIRSAPAILGDIETQFLTDLIHEITQLSTKRMDEKKEEKIIRFSCKRSIKAGQELTLPQMTNMIEELRYADNPFTCPHGRPIMLRISYSELEKMFKRTG
jgi:DNA mismatch repair protein MutL